MSKDQRMYWDLSNIYCSVDSIELNCDYECCVELVDALRARIKVNEDSMDKLGFYLTAINTLYAKLNKIENYIQLVLSTDVLNKCAYSIQQKVKEIRTESQKVRDIYESWINNLNISDFYNKSDFIRNYKTYLEEIEEKSKHIIKDQIRDVADNFSLYASTMWRNLYNKIISEMTFELNHSNGTEESVSLSNSKLFQYNNDKKIRKAFFLSQMNAYKRNEDIISICLNSIKGEALYVSKLKKYDSPLDMSLGIAKTKREHIEQMFKVVKEKIHIFNKYFSKKAEMLYGCSKLPYFDLFIPCTQSSRKFNVEDAKDIIINSFRAFNKNLEDLSVRAFDESWIDFEPRKNKISGGLHLKIVSNKESRILVNFEGHFSDVVNLAHELGHAYQNYNVMNTKPPVLTDVPLSLCEIGSTFCEYLVYDYVTLNYTEDNAFALENYICYAAQIIIDIYIRYSFEVELFELRKKKFVSAEELNNLVLDMQKKCYSEILDYSYPNPYIWLYKPHFYDVNNNFYNYPYTFGFLIATHLFNSYQSNSQKESFGSKIESFFSNTSTEDISVLLSDFNMDINQPVFWEEAFNKIEEKISEFLNLL